MKQASDLRRVHAGYAQYVNNYHCYTEKGRRTAQDDYSYVWAQWMHYTFLCYSIYSVVAVIAIFGAWKGFLRPIGGCLLCLAQIFALVCTIALTVIRFGEKGEFCVEKAGSTDSEYRGEVSEQLASDGQFLQRAVIAMWSLGCIHCCLLASGLSPK